MGALRFIYFFIVVILLAGSACSTVQITEEARTPTQLVPHEPAQIVPTKTAPPESRFFTEEFDSEANLVKWETFSLGAGQETNLVIQQEDDHLFFDLGDENLYIYYMYTPYEYKDISIKLNAENQGQNNNNISLVCRMSSDKSQWYEFSVESEGLWYLYAMDGEYNIISNGDASALKQGREVNEYAMTCRGDEITLSINGEELRTVKDATYGFGSGLVGFNISSLNVLPITVEVNWFEISQP